MKTADMKPESELTLDDIKEIGGTHWVNAFLLIGRPSDRLAMEVGHEVLRQLKNSEVCLDTLGIKGGKVTWVRFVAS